MVKGPGIETTHWGSVRWHIQRYNDLIYYMDWHQFTIAAWADAMHEKKIENRATLVTADAHRDTRTFDSSSINSLDKILESGRDVLNSVANFVDSSLRGDEGEDRFLPPAIYMKTIGDTIYLIPSCDPKKAKIQTLHFAYYDEAYGRFLFFEERHPPEYYEGKREIRVIPVSMAEVSEKLESVNSEDLILDIDLDYFANLDEMPSNPSKKELTDAVDKFVGDIGFIPGIITVATANGRYMPPNFNINYLLNIMINRLEAKFCGGKKVEVDERALDFIEFISK